MLKNEIFIKRLIYGAFILCFSLLTLALIIAKNSPALGYESSIYISTPIFFWIAIFVSLCTSIIIIVYQASLRKIESSNIWKTALILLFFIYVACLSLFIIRGYYMWCIWGDPATHIFYTKQIMGNGKFSSDLFYPILHIYTTEILLLTNLNIIAVHKILPLVSGCLYVPYMYILSRFILYNQRQVIFATVLSCALISDWYLNFTPNYLANNIFPLIFFILLKAMSSKNVSWELLLMISIFLYPVLHPVPTIAFMILILALPLPNQLSHILGIDNKDSSPKGTLFLRLKIPLFFIFFVWAITWISSFYLWEATIINIYTLITEEVSSSATLLMNQIYDAQKYGYSVTEQIIKQYGAGILLTLMAFASFSSIVKIKILEERKNFLLALYGPLVLFSLIIMLFYLLNFSFSPLRLFVYITIISTIISGYYIDTILKHISKIKNKKIQMLSMCIIILMLVSIFCAGIMELYPSPYIKSVNYQTPKTEVDGMSWLFEKRALDIQITGILVEPHRFSDYILSKKEKDMQNIPWKIKEYLKVPYHFGYDLNLSLANTYKYQTYIVILKKDKTFYTDVFPEMAPIRWKLQDFNNLDIDKGLYKVYSNSEFDVFSTN